MRKKLLVGFVLAISLIFSFTFCFANDEIQKASNSVKNAVGGAENAVEGAARNAGNAIQGVGNTIRDGMNNAGNEIRNSAQKTGNTIENAGNHMENAMSDNTNNQDNQNNNSDSSNDYTATRTSGEETFMGMTSNTWSWLILGIAAVAIIGLVWYYSMQLNNNKIHKDEQNLRKVYNI